MDPDTLMCVLELDSFDAENLESSEDSDSENEDEDDKDMSEEHLEKRRDTRRTRVADREARMSYRMSDEGIIGMLQKQYCPKSLKATSRILSAVHMVKNGKVYVHGVGNKISRRVDECVVLVFSISSEREASRKNILG